MNRKKKLKIILIALGVLLGIGLIFGILAFIDYNTDLFADDDDYEFDMDEEEPFDGYVRINGNCYKLQRDVKTLLIMGTDVSGNEEGVGEEYQGSMADFLLLMVIDEEAGQYGFIQLNRDTMTDVPLLLKDDTAYASAWQQLCIAHWYGKDKKASCKNTVDTISHNLLGGMPINGYYALSMDSMVPLNHALGGVEVTIEDDFSKADPSLKMGETIKLTDEQAAIFMRHRMDVGDGENQSRMRRHRMYMNAVMNKLKNEVKNSRKFIARVFNEMQPYTTTNIKGKTVDKLGQLAGKLQDVGLYTPDGESKLGISLADGLPHAEFTMDESSMEEIMLKLYPMEQCEDPDPVEEDEDEDEDDDEEDEDSDEDDEEDGEE